MTKSAKRLQKKGELALVREGFYINVVPEHRALGSLPADWFIDSLMQYLEQPYYIALLSAATYYGASHQQPQVLQVITSVQTRAIQIGKVGIEFVYKRDFPTVGLKPFNSYTGTVQVSSPVLTALDVCDYPQHAGFIHNMAQVIADLAPSITPEQLEQQLSSGYIKTTILQRLGYLLTLLSSDDLADIIEIYFRDRHVKKYLMLVPGESETIIEKNKRWKLNINEEVELDL